MPHFSLKVDPRAGPVVEVIVGVSTPRRAALTAAKLSVPSPVVIKALIDTGASITSIDCKIIQQLQIPSTGTIPVHTPSTTAGAPHVANLYDVGLFLAHQKGIRPFEALAVTESHLEHQGIRALIGRDVLKSCLLTYDGATQSFCLGF